MNIFLSFLQSPKNYNIPAYSFWQYYIKNGIEEAGWQWSECPDADWALGIVPQSKADHQKWKEYTWDKTLAWLKEHPADLFLSYLYPDQIDVTAIKEIQKMGIPCVNFFCDNVREFRKAPVEYGLFDLNWVPEYKAVDFYQNAGYGYIHLPMPVWVHPDDRTVKKEEYDQITFLGSVDVQRQLLLEEIIRLAPDLPLAIYGYGWDNKARQSGPAADGHSITKKIFNQLAFLQQKGLKAYINKINNRNYAVETSAGLLQKYKGGHQVEQYKTLTAGSMITVGINRYPSFHFPLFKPDTYSRLRDIEAPMLGACYLTEYAPGIEYLYDIGTEIEVFKDADDFIEKATTLMADDNKRKALRSNGQKRALQDHSIPNSLNKIVQNLGIK